MSRCSRQVCCAVAACRRERFYNEDVEKVLKANMDILTAVFKVGRGIKVLGMHSSGLVHYVVPRSYKRTLHFAECCKLASFF